LNAISPVIPGSEEFEVVYAKDQPEYNALPVLRTDKTLVSRWKFSEEEREMIANGADLFICVMHFGQPLQPILPILGEDNAIRAMVEIGAPI
jgi:hypothetical protein